MTIELELLRLNLEQARQRVIAELGRLESEGVSVLERLEAIKNDKQGTLSNIERALQKIAEGTYGLCDKCGQPIDEGRLDILPHTSLCLTCT